MYTKIIMKNDYTIISQTPSNVTAILPVRDNLFNAYTMNLSSKGTVVIIRLENDAKKESGNTVLRTKCSASVRKPTPM